MPSSLITVLAAVGLDLAFGDPPNKLHPVAWMGSYIRWMWRRCPQGEDDQKARRGQFIWGTVLVMLGVGLFGLPWILLSLFDLPLFWLLSIPLLKLTLALRGLQKAGGRIEAALAAGDLGKARALLSRDLVSRSTGDLSGPQVVAATIESLSENITDGLSSPLFYYVLFGLPGAWIYRFINTCDSMLGYRYGAYEYGGKLSACLDTVLNWVPARISGLLMVSAAALAGEDPAGAWQTMRTQHGRTASANAGWTMAAAAGALSLNLEKIGHYHLEGGDGPLDGGAILRCLRLVRWASILIVLFNLLLLGGLYALSV